MNHQFRSSQLHLESARGRGAFERTLARVGARRQNQRYDQPATNLLPIFSRLSTNTTRRAKQQPPAKPGAPTIGISSARGAFVYWLASDNSDKEQEDAAASEDDDHDHDHDHGGRAAKASRKILRQTAVLDSLDSQLSFSCEMPNQHQHPHQHQQRPHEEATGGGGGGSAQLEAHLAGHKALWYVNNQLLKSSQPRDILNTTLRLLGFGSKLASLEITCAHQTLSLTNQQGLAGSVFHAANSVRILQSTNAIDLRLKGKFSLRPLGGAHLVISSPDSCRERHLAANDPTIESETNNPTLRLLSAAGAICFRYYASRCRVKTP